VLTQQRCSRRCPARNFFAHNVDSAPAFWWLDDLWIVLAEAKDTGGRFSMMEELLPKDSGPWPHKHTWSDETFYILDGEIAVLIGDEIKSVRKGDFLMVPRNTRHAFRVTSETARLLNGYTPASREACLVEFATPATARTLPPAGASPTIEMTPALLSRYGMDMLPSPDPLRPRGRSFESPEPSLPQVHQRRALAAFVLAGLFEVGDVRVGAEVLA
jgi:mannose-6-phosphate isomerase-like protein (cupin superfamily)